MKIVNSRPMPESVDFAAYGEQPGITQLLDLVEELVGLLGATEDQDSIAISGTFLQGAAAGTTAVDMTAGGYAQLNQVHGLIDTAADANAYASQYVTMTVTASQTNNVSIFGIWSELYLTGTQSTNGNNAAIWGNLEMSGTITGPGSTSTYLGAFVGTIISAATLTNSGIMGAFIADSLLTSGFTNNAVIAAFVAHVNASHATKANWPIGLYFDGVDVAFGFGSATNYEDGIKASVATPSGNTSHAIKIKIGSSTYGYIPVYDAETF